MLVVGSSSRRLVVGSPPSGRVPTASLGRFPHVGSGDTLGLIPARISRTEQLSVRSWWAAKEPDWSIGEELSFVARPTSA